jgi:hypothetical protein
MLLILPESVYSQIRKIVFETTVETGVTLFGAKEGEDFRVLYVCGPGPKADHQEFEYSGDEDYATFVYENLLKDHPDLKHIGELHVHPMGMRELSRTDRETVNKVLKDYEEFVAGVMLRRFKHVSFYPVYFSRLKEEYMKVRVDW